MQCSDTALTVLSGVNRCALKQPDCQTWPLRAHHAPRLNHCILSTIAAVYYDVTEQLINQIIDLRSQIQCVVCIFPASTVSFILKYFPNVLILKSYSVIALLPQQILMTYDLMRL